MNKRVNPTYPLLSGHRFTWDNSGGHHRLPYPWKHTDAFTYQLDKGWKVLGWCPNDKIGNCARRADDGHQYVAFLFEAPDAYDYWFHFYHPDWLEPEEAFRFIET